MSGDGRAPVAIIGAGVAGLSCAASIANAVERDGPVVELIDQGSRGRGGRASSSRPTTHDPPLVFDHGCQFFTAESEAFRETCAALERAGHIARWGGRFGTLDASTGVFRAKSENDAKAGDDFFRLLAAKDAYVGVPTMRGLCDGLRELIPENAAVDSPQCAVTRLERARDEDADENATPWVVSGVGGRALDEARKRVPERALGAFRAVVATDVMLAKAGTPGSCAFEGVAGVSDEEAPPRPEEVSGASARAAATWRVMRGAPAESLFSLMVAFGAGGGGRRVRPVRRRGGHRVRDDPAPGARLREAGARDEHTNDAEPVDRRVHCRVRGAGRRRRAAERGRRVQPANRGVLGARDPRDGRGDE